MESILISIKPKFCDLIFRQRTKKYEFRAKEPRAELPTKYYVYETQGKISTPWMDEDGHEVYKGSGMVIGEFVCDHLITLLPDQERPEVYQMDDAELAKNGLTQRELWVYGAGRPICGIHIAKEKLYDRPVDVQLFRRACPYKHADCGTCFLFDREKMDCGAPRIKKPPQMYMYVEDLLA